MAYKVFLLFIVLHTGILGMAQVQNAIDSIEGIMGGQKDSALCSSYNELTWLYRSINRDKAFNYGQKAIALGRQTGYKKGIAQAWNDLGILYADKQDFDSAIYAYEQAKTLREVLKDSKGLAAVHLKMGIVHQKAGRYADALEQGLKALNLYDSIGDNFGSATASQNVGIVNQNMGNVDAALQYHLRSIALREKIQDRSGLSASYLAVGNIYYSKKQVDSAKSYFEASLSLAETVHNNEVISTASHNLAAVYNDLKDFAKGLSYIEAAYDIRLKTGDTKPIVSSLNIWGSLLTGLKQYQAAENKLKDALTLADTLQSCLPEKPRIYESLEALYEATGDYKKANEMGKLQLKYRDSIYTADMNLRFSELETKYETSKKEQQIQEQQFALTKKNYWLFGISGFVLLSSLLAWSGYRRFKLKKEKQLAEEVMHQQDLATRAILQAEEDERKRIAAELHDGVGQMMSAARMNLNAFETEIAQLDESGKNRFSKIIDLVDESCKEVRAVSHQMMPNALLKRGLANAVRDFVEKLDTRILKVDLYSEGLSERIDSNMETVLYRVIQECVNNVIKHSGASHLDLSLIKDTAGVSITIEDNGKGFDTNNKANFEGIGLKNITSRITYLKGIIEFDSAPGKGTLVAIHVPFG